MTLKPPLRKFLEEKGGIIMEREGESQTVRLHLPGGNITPDQLSAIGRIARRLGIGTVHLTTRQTMEIPHLPMEQVPSLLKSLEKADIGLGAEHEEVVNITACPGSEQCRLANVETGNLLRELDEAHFGKDMRVRVRIAISACPNGCTSERLSEIGITGLREPIRNDGLCTGCGTCANTCRERAIYMSNGLMVLDSDRCLQCGMCIDSCPFHIIRGSVPRYLITVGGRRGRHPQLGRDLVTVDSEEEAIQVVDRVVDWIFRYAYSGRILTDQMDAMDFEGFRDRIRAEFG